MKVLLGEISSYKAIVIAKHLKEVYGNRGIEIIAYDYKPLMKYIHSRFVDDYVGLKKCGKDKESYVKQLANCVHDLKADVLIPVHSDYIGEILHQKGLFGHSLDYMGQYSDYILLHEKDRLMALAKELGVRIPVNYASIEESKVPFVVKPTALSSAKGVRYCMREEDKTSFFQNRHNTVCQEYIAGTGCGYSVYCRQGKILKEYGHLRLAEFPISGGSSVYRTGYNNPKMREAAERILGRIPWTGFAMFEFKLTADGEVILIEVNPRIWGSIHQALANGCLMFDEIVCDGLTNQKKGFDNIRTCLWPHVWIAALEYGLKKNDWGVMKGYIRHKAKKDVSLLSDFWGYMSMVIRKLI